LATTGIKLGDEQMRKFICDGVLVLDSGVDSAVNTTIFEKIQWNSAHEFNMGNNVLPRIPELQKVLDSPIVHGALQSVLGDEYLLHPHRFMHASEPLDEETRQLALNGDEHGPAMGTGSSGTSFWHQDAQSPLSRSRYHVPRLAMILYFPQDTPVERGPTRVIPGTQLQARLFESDYPNAFVADNIKAGTCLLIAFDIAHAGLSNRTDASRYMFKFVFMRTRTPTVPSWQGGDGAWQTPVTRLSTAYNYDDAWAYIWNWLRGQPTLPSRATAGSSDVVAELVSHLNQDDQNARLCAIYQLASLGAVDAVVQSLLTAAGKSREQALGYKKKATGGYKLAGDPNERRWNEGAYVLEDEAYALGAMGAIAMDALVDLLAHDDPWIRINAAFALGEIGPSAAAAMPSLASQLSHPVCQVARAALDAMACIGRNTAVALPAITKLLTIDNPQWQEPLGRHWTGENQARFNAMCALLNSDIPIADIEDLLVDCLEDANGYVPALALEALTRDGGRNGMQHALAYLKTHRWDDTLAAGQRVY
jgi:HEAT repeat protein